MKNICAIGILFLVSCAAPIADGIGVDPEIGRDSLLNEAAALFGDGRFFEAEQRYRLALQRSPQDASIRLSLATVLSRENNASVSEATKLFQALLREHPEALAVILGAAAGYQQLGNLETSMALFMKGYFLAADDAIASVIMRNYATVAFQNGQIGEALCGSLGAYQRKPSAIEASRHMVVLNSLGLIKEALAFGSQALTEFPDDPELTNRTAESYAAMHQCSNAQELATRVLEQGRLSDNLRRDARMVIDWCDGNNRLKELSADTLATWPVQMRLAN